MEHHELISLAGKAGIYAWYKKEWSGNTFVLTDEGLHGDWACLQQFANLVAAAEREACARVCEGRANGYRHETDVYAHEHIAEANYCAAAIRGRGEK